MAGSSAEMHESPDDLSGETVDRHRAVVSLMEELEAVDWYDQRVEATEDDELRAILAHNRDEEKEHAAMVLEWLRRRDPRLDAELRESLFTSGPIAHGTGEADETAEAAGEAGADETAEADGEAGAGKRRGGRVAGSDGSLGIGSLRGEMQQ